MPHSKIYIPAIPDRLTIDKQAVAILSSATRAAKAILERRAALDKQERRDEPLIVLAGENHHAPSHLIHHMLVIDKLAKSGETLSAGLEFEHNILAEAFCEYNEAPYDPDIAPVIAEQDKDGRHALSCLFAAFNSPSADFSRHILQSYLLGKPDIKICFADTACRGDYLDRDEPVTRHHMQKVLGRTSRFIHYSVPEGMSIRNSQMSDIFGQFARRHKSRIAFQMGGYAHPAGFVSGRKLTTHDHLFKDSLAAYYKRDDLPVLIMPILSDEFTACDLPPDINASPDEIFLVKDVPKIEAFYEAGTGFAIKGCPAALKTRKEEADWVNAVMARTGAPHPAAGIKDIFRAQNKAGDAVAELFETWCQTPSFPVPEP